MATEEKQQDEDIAPHHHKKIYTPLQHHDSALTHFKHEHAQSIADPISFWDEKGKELLDWFRPYSKVMHGGFEHGDVGWYIGGKLNVCYNCVDRHDGDKLAIVWEGDEPDDIRKITYGELLRQVCRIANALLQKGVVKGDVITIYMPMIPELAMTMLACARIGAVHSVVFAGFSAEALAQRISAANSKLVVTCDQFHRGGKKIGLKDIVNDARNKLNCEELLRHVLVFERNNKAVYEMKSKDVRMDELVANQRPYCPPAEMDSEDNLFILYTSGSTGKPKGLLHTSAGYAVYAMLTSKTTFDYQANDLFACVADCGWITGHTYVVYGPLLNGITTFMFESTPVYPTPSRYWEMVERHSINSFYTAPTAIRLLMRYGDELPSKYSMNSLRILGTVGEPINPEAWRWYYQVIGKSKCTVVDTYWQTETGGHVITNIPGITPMKPGSCTLPFYGIDPVVLDPLDGHQVTEKDEHDHISGVLAFRHPWPGMARTCLNDHDRYLAVYFKPYKGYYFTGDSVVVDDDGYHFIIGRVDDVINVSGHRIGTAEVESALVLHPAVAQAAAVGQPHSIKGQSIVAFCMLTATSTIQEDSLIQELRKYVRNEIGAFAIPDVIVVTPSLPMTRSGKIMRRILRKIVCDEVDSIGDVSTLADPSIVETLIEKMQKIQPKK